MVEKATVPFPAQEPVNEMDEVIGRLRTLELALLADSQKLERYDTGYAAAMVRDVMHRLEPIRTFLAENDLEGDELSFLECRRTWFAAKGGAA